MYSKVDAGSTFWIELPLLEQVDIRQSFAENPSLMEEEVLPVEVFPESVPEPKTEPAPQLTEGALPLANKLILLIEDDLVNQQVISAFVERLGARVDIAKNGMEGLSFWRTHPKLYDAILMDCQMPIMDGYEATTLIRKEEGFMDMALPVPIIALTANAMPEDRARCLAVGMNDFIAKPVDIQQFNQSLIKWAGSKREEL